LLLGVVNLKTAILLCGGHLAAVASRGHLVAAVVDRSGSGFYGNGLPVMATVMTTATTSAVAIVLVNGSIVCSCLPLFLRLKSFACNRNGKCYYLYGFHQ
jgi:hypothetical protein